ncbi:MAG: hypothetical protein MJZ61_04390 [Bacteroidales bacterium]|nr:hypothetical protein [Bacteroidales bacterium]
MTARIITAIIALIAAINCMGQNIGNVLSAIENHQLITLPNGFRVQIVTTSEYKYVNCRLSANVSTISEEGKPGIKQVVAAMTGSDLVANEIIVKNMISHDKALDSLMGFMSEVLYGQNPTYVNFDEYKTRRINYLRGSQNSLDILASNAIGLSVVSAENLERITSSDYLEYRNLCFSPEKCLLTIVSDADAGIIQELANKYFGSAAKTVSKAKPMAAKIASKDEIHFINDSTLQQYEVVYKNYYPCAKTPKNYILNTLAYNIVYGNHLSKTSALSCFKYDVNTLSTDGENDDFPAFTANIFACRRPDFDAAQALPAAKSNVLSQFNQRLKMPDYAAEIAADLILYTFPKNYFSNYETAVNMVTAQEQQAFLSQTIKNGSSVMLVRGNQAELHCELIRQAFERDVCFLDSDNNIGITLKKGFGVESILRQYLSSTGLSIPPQNMMVTFKSAYIYPDGKFYAAGGKVIRKYPNMYRMDNFVMHSDTMRIFHFKEVYNGISGMDSTMLYGAITPDSLRANVLRQKAVFPQEAHYQELGFDAKLVCNYDLYRAGYHRLDVTDGCGRKYRDYYSIVSGLREKSEILDSVGIAKTITYEYEKHGKYTLPKTALEESPDLRIEIIFGAYDTSTKWKKTDFELQLIPPKKKKR